MDKNLLKIGSLVFVVVAIVVLLIYGNPYAPPVIEKGNLKLVADRDIKNSYIDLFKNNQKILSFWPYRDQIKYNGTYQRIFGYNRNDTLFNENDSRRVDVGEDKMIITYFNEKKDPKEVSLIFILNGTTLNYRINVSGTKNLEEIKYTHTFNGMGYEEFITPSDDLIKNEGNKTYTWQGGMQIPKISKNYQLMLSNETMLNISGNFSRIMNLPPGQCSYFYTAPNESINIKVQNPMEINLTEKGLSLRAGTLISDEYIHLYNKNNQKILSFWPYRDQIKYNGTYQRIFGYNRNDTLFNENDSRRVDVGEDKMIITYFNEKKDPKEVSLIFILNGTTLNYRINVSGTKNLEEIKYTHTFNGMGYEEFITPSDDLIKNEGNKTYTWQGGMQIPKISKNYQLMLSNETMLNISGNFSRIMNLPPGQCSYFYTAPNESINIKVQNPMEINLTEKGLSLRAGTLISDEYIHLYNKNNQKILSFWPYRDQIKYNGTYQRIFGYNRNDTLFNENDSRRVDVGEDKMIITYFNEKKDPKEVSLIFILNRTTLNYRINVSGTKNLEEIKYTHTFNGMGYEEFITPSDDLIKNEGNKTYTWQGGMQIPKISKNYQLMLSNETMLNISGNFSRIMNLPPGQCSYFYVNPNETMTIKVQEPIKLNLTQKYPLTISTSSTISDGIHIYKNGTKILFLSTWEAIFKHDGRTQRLLSSLKYDEDYPNKLLFNYNNSAKITKISEIKQNNKTTGYEMNVSWVNESRDVQEIGFSIKIYENKSYAEIKYIYRTKNAYVNLEPLSYGISFDKNRFTYIKVIKNSEITGNIKRSPVENEKRGYLNFAGCEQGKCDKIIADQWFIDKGNKNYEKAVEIKGNFSRIEHYFTYNLVRFYMDDFKEPLKIYVD